MTTAAEPRSAELPLPGGRDEATVKLHPLLGGRAMSPKAALLRESGRLAWRRALGLGVGEDGLVPIPIPAFLVEHPGAGLVLIDTGLHPSVAVKPRENFGRVTLLAFRDLRMEPDQALPAQLRERGHEASDVKAVVMTHLHVDHASGISEFPQATFVVSRAEWEAATSQGQTHGYVTRQFDHAFDYRLLDFDGSDVESFAGFARSFDLFGDGSVRTVYTPGHTLGHMSVVLRTGRGEVLVAGDAIYLRRTLDDTHLPHRLEDEHLFRRSLREIRQYTRETPDALIIPGHDWEEWQKLEAVY
ncbi:MAG TPA: N-acyl homoserine lactonase family protein [Thermoleophilaceae bacterium]|jgi:glyoxylase-like metal-dependent hydrolase (beta-lactamase superfamily II)|nr:N-acyl homoserine lactonase family protein [Thermoleophilaceae bacterium]